MEHRRGAIIVAIKKRQAERYAFSLSLYFTCYEICYYLEISSSS